MALGAGATSNTICRPFTQDLPKIRMRLLNLIIHARQEIGVSMNLNITTGMLTET